LHVASKYLVYSSLDVVRVDEGIGVGLQPFVTVKNGLACATELAPVTVPGVRQPLEPNVSIVAGE